MLLKSFNPQLEVVEYFQADKQVARRKIKLQKKRWKRKCRKKFKVFSWKIFLEYHLTFILKTSRISFGSRCFLSHLNLNFALSYYKIFRSVKIVFNKFSNLHSVKEQTKQQFWKLNYYSLLFTASIVQICFVWQFQFRWEIKLHEIRGMLTGVGGFFLLPFMEFLENGNFLWWKYEILEQ